ncbi:hypothetical protein QTP88_010254 [Uroleucon formosanum]
MIITIPKPGKPPDTPESYRPISRIPTLVCKQPLQASHKVVTSLLSSILYSQQTSLPQSIPLLGSTPTTQPYSPPATTLMKQISNFKTTWISFPTGSSLGKSKSMTPNQLMLQLHSAREHHPL